MTTVLVARLWGRVGTSKDYEELNACIPSVPITIGRTRSSDEGEVPHLCVGDQDNISRKHAVLYWDEKDRSYKMKCLSKNGFIVDGKTYQKDQVAGLISKSSVRLGCAKFYFLLPNTFKSKSKVQNLSLIHI